MFGIRFHQCLAAVARLGILQELGQSEIEHLELRPVFQKQIRRLDVAVNDSFLVRRVERVGRLNSDLYHLCEWQRPPRQNLVQRLAFQQFHRQKSAPILFLDRMDRADARMIERRCRACLAQKALQRGGILRRFFRQELQCNAAAQLRVFRLINDAHSAAAHLADHAIVRDDLIFHGEKKW